MSLESDFRVRVFIAMKKKHGRPAMSSVFQDSAHLSLAVAASDCEHAARRKRHQRHCARAPRPPGANATPPSHPPPCCPATSDTSLTRVRPDEVLCVHGPQGARQSRKGWPRVQLPVHQPEPAAPTTAAHQPLPRPLRPTPLPSAHGPRSDIVGGTS